MFVGVGGDDRLLAKLVVGDGLLAVAVHGGGVVPVVDVELGRLGAFPDPGSFQRCVVVGSPRDQGLQDDLAIRFAVLGALGAVGVDQAGCRFGIGECPEPIAVARGDLRGLGMER